MMPPNRRSELLSLLSEACEVEHALACSYLFAAFSLKTKGLPWEHQQRVRLWAAQVYFVASQEMLHLAQVWNLLTAVGGVPYYGRPAFPVDRDYFPIGSPLTLERYHADTLARFVRWEQPIAVRQERSNLGPAVRATVSAAPYRSVGELYERIEEIFRAPAAPTLFVGRREHQVGPAVVDFPDLIPVYTPEDAVRAIAAIRHQGEGSAKDREDCHFGIFFDLHAALAGLGFDPAHEVVANPTTRAGQGTLVTNPASVAAMSFFDDVYVLMLRMLAWTFGPIDAAGPLAARFARAALVAMVALLKPLGEVIANLPSGAAGHAGPSFRIGRHIPLPLEGDVARVLVAERWDELSEDSVRLLQHDRIAAEIPQLTAQVDAIRRLLG